MKRYSLFLITLVLSVINVMAEPSLTVVDANVTNVCMSKRLVRVFDNYITAEDCGMGLEVTVNLKVEGLDGMRILCIVNPLDAEGNTMNDRQGEAHSTAAFNVVGNSDNCTVTVPLPYNWLVTEETKASGKVMLGVTAMAIGQEAGDMKIFTIDESKMNIDRSNLPNKLMGDVLGGSTGEDGLLGGLMGSLFGTADATSEEECPSCEGSRICPHCDGMGYLDPTVCRKCINDPGFCRRCHGIGTITREYNFN